MATTSQMLKKKPLARRNSNVFAQFDQKQIAEFKEAFTFIDQNGDGVVDREDLQEVWQSLGKLLKGEISELLTLSLSLVSLSSWKG